MLLDYGADVLATDLVKRRGKKQLFKGESNSKVVGSEVQQPSDSKDAVA